MLHRAHRGKRLGAELSRGPCGAFEENGRVEVGIPTSPLAVDLTVEKEVVTVGPYARYAQKFLGVRGALSDKTLYSVQGGARSAA